MKKRENQAFIGAEPLQKPLGFIFIKKTMMQLFGDFKHLFITFIKYLVPISITNTYNPDYQKTMTQKQLNP
ncbi:MAG: hypothetical protein V4549_17405 [Bacteroidota bacterium]